MSNEYAALIRNKTWKLVPYSPIMPLVGNKWVFKTKCRANGLIETLKAGFVAKGFHQTSGIDYT